MKYLAVASNKSSEVTNLTRWRFMPFAAIMVESITCKVHLKFTLR